MNNIQLISHVTVKSCMFSPPLRLRTRQKCPLKLLLIQCCIGDPSPVQYSKKINKRHIRFRKEETKNINSQVNSLYTQKIQTNLHKKELAELLRELSKVKRQKFKIKKSTGCLYTSNKQQKIASKKRSVQNMCKTCTENYKTLLR